MIILITYNSIILKGKSELEKFLCLFEVKIQKENEQNEGTSTGSTEPFYDEFMMVADKNGYVSKNKVIEMIKLAGFKLPQSRFEELEEEHGENDVDDRLSYEGIFFFFEQLVGVTKLVWCTLKAI